MRKNNKKRNLYFFVITLLVFLGIGYALLTQELTINGTSKVTASSWHIYFDNLVLNSNNVALSSGDQNATIDSVTETDITYTVTLQNPGDFYEFTVDVVNDGTIDAMIGSVTSTLGGVEIDQENPLPSYLNYSITYSDGGPILVNQKLDHNTLETYKVRLEYRTDITSSDLPATDQTLTLSFGVNYVQADDSSQVVTHPVSFADDSWETIIAAVKVGNTSAYHVGDTKTIELGNNLGTHMIRIVNTSSPLECEGVDFSETACGFVLEFVDILSMNRMNYWNNDDYDVSDGNGNVGGWPASEIRTYLNSTTDSTSVYNSLPSVLKNAIIDTTVVSSHGEDDFANFISTDKLYLLATHEICADYAETYGASWGLYTDDSSYYNTRQLDYYAQLGITASSPLIKKKYYDTFSPWWLRSADVSSMNTFYYVDNTGDYKSISSSNTYGVSPAFRLAGPSATRIPKCQPFEQDSWETIVSNAKTNNYSQYEVGCKKEITLGNNYGTHFVRVANTSTPAERGRADFSESACGFVLEFVDSITMHRMNPWDGDNNSTTVGNGNIGGWSASEFYTLLNSTSEPTSIYNSLPEVLKMNIIDTVTISGHGSAAGEDNFVSTDKLYLLSTREIMLDDGETPNGIDIMDSAYNNTRQLDYYSFYNNVTKYHMKKRYIKKMGFSKVGWALRSVYLSSPRLFFYISTNANWTIDSVDNSYGISPAFRLG